MTQVIEAPERGQAALWSYVDGQYVPDMPVDWIARWEGNPRKHFPETELSELADSITRHGVQQPIVVRMLEERDPDGPLARVRIVMGERRWRAAKIAGLTAVPCLVRVGMDDREALTLAFVENVRRNDLNAIERADAFRALSDAGYSQQEIAAQIGVDRATVTNALRLRKLPDAVKDLVIEGSLMEAHARAILRFEGFPEVQQRIAEIAAASGASAKSLEKGIPYVRELWTAKLVKGFTEYEVKFDLADNCRACPFSAYRKSDGYPEHVCLKPEHWDELQAAALVEIERKREAMVKEATARKEALKQTAVAASMPLPAPAAAGGADDVAEPATDTKTEATPPPAEAPMLRISDLKHEEYAELWGTPCTCTEECPCRVTVAGYDGKPKQICIDPNRFRSLKAQETRQVNIDRKKRFAAQLEEYAARDRTDRDDVRANVLLLYPIIRSASAEARRKAMEAVQIPEGELRDFLNGYVSANEDRQVWHLFEALSLQEMFTFALECRIREAARYAQESELPRIAPLDYYLRQEPAQTEETPDRPFSTGNGEPVFRADQNTEDGDYDDDEGPWCEACEVAIAKDLMGGQILEVVRFPHSTRRHTILDNGMVIVADSDDAEPETMGHYCPDCAEDLEYCQGCGCTYEVACDGGCHWADDGHTLCSQCEGKEAPVESEDRLCASCGTAEAKVGIFCDGCNPSNSDTLKAPTPADDIVGVFMR